MRELFSIRPYALIWVVGLVQGIGFFLLVNVPGRFLELGLTEGMIGLVYSGAALAGLGMRPILGRTLDVVHRRTVIRVAGVVNAFSVAGLAAMTIAGPVLFGWFVVARASQIAIATATLTYAADTLPVHLRTRGLAIFGLSGLIPIGVANVAGDRIISLTGYTGAIFTSAAMALAASVLVWWLPTLPVLGERARRSFWAALAQPDLRIIWFVTLIFSMGLESLFAFMRAYVESHPAVGTLGAFFGIYGLFAVLSRLTSGTRFGMGSPRRTIAIGISGLAGTLLLLAVAEGPGVFLGAAVIGGIAHGAVFPLLSTEVVGRARTAERGSAVATFTSLFDIAILGVVPLVGGAIDLAGYPAAFSGLAITMLAGVVVYVRWDLRVSRLSTAPAVVGD